MRKAIFPVLLGFALFSHCVSPPSKPHPTTNYQAVNAVLSSKSVFAEGSLYACILNLYYQGIPLKQAGEECALKMLDADQKDLFVEDDKVVIDTPTGKVGPGAKEYYDPYQVQAACGQGDPRIGQSSSGVGKWPGKGEYTWGGDPQHFHGYAKEDSFKMKEQAVKDAEQAKKEFWDAHDKAEEAKKQLEEAKKQQDEAKKKGDEEAKKKADEEVKKAQEKYDEAYKKAQEKAADSIEKGKKAEEDPNKKQKGSSRTVEGETACEQALQAARELLWECHRTGWRAFECQQLQAKMNHCPDPGLILVDPEQGYACGEKIDKEALKNAWVARCEQLKRYNPEGPNPCQPPTIDNPGRYLKGKGIPNACEPDPQSYVDPHDDSCITEVEIKPYGEPDLQKILVYGLNKFGGPVVVIPPKDPDPPPIPGPEPQPGPK